MPCSEQGQPGQAAQDCIISGFDIRMESLNFSGLSMPLSSHPHSRKVFSYVQVEFPVFQCVSFVLSLGATDKSLAPSFFIPSQQVFINMDQIPLRAFSSPD